MSVPGMTCKTNDNVKKNVMKHAHPSWPAPGVLNIFLQKVWNIYIDCINHTMVGAINYYN
jgi:hypothetical protein